MVQAPKEICVDLLYGLVVAAGVVDLSGGLMTADDQPGDGGEMVSHHQ